VPVTNSTEVFENSTRPIQISRVRGDSITQVFYFVRSDWPPAFGERIATSEIRSRWLNSADKEFDNESEPEASEEKQESRAGEKARAQEPPYVGAQPQV
jgi:hypothetical protein